MKLQFSGPRILLLALDFIFYLSYPFDVFINLHHQFLIVVFQALVHIEERFGSQLGFLGSRCPHNFILFEFIKRLVSFALHVLHSFREVCHLSLQRLHFKLGVNV